MIDHTTLPKTRISQHFDGDGYPTDAALHLIKEWRWEDPEGWIKFIHSVWYQREFGFHTEQCVHVDWSGHDLKATRVYLSTAGWGGNELIIRTMQKNAILWDDTWESSRRGGHHIFEIVWEEIPE